MWFIIGLSTSGLLGKFDVFDLLTCSHAVTCPSMAWWYMVLFVWFASTPLYIYSCMTPGWSSIHSENPSRFSLRHDVINSSNPFVGSILYVSGHIVSSRDSISFHLEDLAWSDTSDEWSWSAWYICYPGFKNCQLWFPSIIRIIAHGYRMARLQMQKTRMLYPTLKLSKYIDITPLEFQKSSVTVASVSSVLLMIPRFWNTHASLEIRKAFKQKPSFLRSLEVIPESSLRKA